MHSFTQWAAGGALGGVMSDVPGRKGKLEKKGKAKEGLPKRERERERKM